MQIKIAHNSFKCVDPVLLYLLKKTSDIVVSAGLLVSTFMKQNYFSFVIPIPTMFEYFLQL